MAADAERLQLMVQMTASESGVVVHWLQPDYVDGLGEVCRSLRRFVTQHRDTGPASSAQALQGTDNRSRGVTADYHEAVVLLLRDEAGQLTVECWYESSPFVGDAQSLRPDFYSVAPWGDFVSALLVEVEARCTS